MSGETEVNDNGNVYMQSGYHSDPHSSDNMPARDISVKSLESHNVNPSPRLVSKRGLRRDIIETLLLVVVIYTLVNLTTARAVVEGPSMQPNFYTGQLVVINRFAYYFAQPARGDVVVIHSPRSDCQDPAKFETNGCEDLIKRVIGLPGETVVIKSGRIYINGAKIEEPYISEFCKIGCDGTWMLKPSEYFVLGDNRNNSYDSHSFGPIQRTLIVGEAWIRYWPPQDAKIIPHPNYPMTLTPNH
jgi:signal peptidase I